MQPPNEGHEQPQQPPYYPPPGQQYGPPQYPQQPYYPPPGQPPKKRRRWPIFLLIGALLLCVIIGVAVAASPKPTSTTTTSATSTTAGSTATPVPTKASTPASQPKWTTVRTFSGSSSKKTPFFTVPDDWRLNWTCHGGEFGGNLTATIYGTGNAYVDLPINATCPAGKTVSDTTEEHQGGSIYLDISALSDWSIQIQELK